MCVREFDRDNICARVGLGLRWVASQAQYVRLSVDLAWSDRDSAAYFQIGAAF